ncbi:YegP family protein [Oryzifoliimicrobium ureilyticus]|uniref:YegP family protein n=1 Tax=Oryzifoliimicrobium ureilyticus TaxID=3113724 RepID=UPI0030761382
MYKFEVYKDKKEEFRFRFKASNGETMFVSEGYKAKASAMAAIESIKKNAPGATTSDTTTATV